DQAKIAELNAQIDEIRAALERLQKQLSELDRRDEVASGGRSDASHKGAANTQRRRRWRTNTAAK
ncbi:hypothetical protein, partial [Nocardia sp. NPDC019309]|uniref:hypothetical protein n=1 Tax=Nocardia sp. NPDC019309 TaxID=3154785 RepID=UPI0033C439F7